MQVELTWLSRLSFCCCCCCCCCCCFCFCFRGGCGGDVFSVVILLGFRDGLQNGDAGFSELRVSESLLLLLLLLRYSRMRSCTVSQFGTQLMSPADGDSGITV